MQPIKHTISTGWGCRMSDRNWNNWPNGPNVLHCGLLFHFPCDILHPHPARAMRPTDVTPSIIRFDPNDAGVSYIASEYVFEVPCEEGASWPGSITWPNCIVERCMGTSQPSITNFTSTDNGNVKVGEKVNYQCNVNTHPGQVQCFYSFIVHINIIPPLTGTWCI